MYLTTPSCLGALWQAEQQGALLAKLALCRMGASQAVHAGQGPLWQCRLTGDIPVQAGSADCLHTGSEAHVTSLGLSSATQEWQLGYRI